MFPLPAATTTLANSKPTADAVFGAFSPYAFMEIGVLVAVAVILFIVYTFRNVIMNIFLARQSDYWQSDSKHPNQIRWHNKKTDRWSDWKDIK